MQFGNLGGGSRPRIARLTKLAQSIYARNNYNGALYLPKNIAALNQLSTGTTPVTAVTDPIGLQLDERFGLALGTELVTNGGFDADTGWTKGVGWTIAGGKATHAAGTGSDIEQGTVSLVAGKAYKITLDVIAVRVASLLYIWDGAVYKELETNVSAGAKTAIIVMAANTTLKIRLGAPADADIDNVTCKLLDGNHSIQATAAARPTWQVDANGKYYISALGTDDCFTSAGGGGGSAGFFWCGAVMPTGGAGTIRTLIDDHSGNNGYIVRIAATNKLVLSAGNGAAFTPKESTAKVDVGTKSIGTVWDDGTNLNVQINDGVVESVARPVVTAGTAGFTRFKNNVAAGEFFIGNEYASCYVKNTGLTAAERAIIQALVRACAGL